MTKYLNASDLAIGTNEKGTPLFQAYTCVAVRHKKPVHIAFDMVVTFS